MRTDVKIGLIFALLVVLGLVAYFAYRGNQKQPAENPPAQVAKTNETPAGSGEVPVRAPGAAPTLAPTPSTEPAPTTTGPTSAAYPPGFDSGIGTTRTPAPTPTLGGTPGGGILAPIPTPTPTPTPGGGILSPIPTPTPAGGPSTYTIKSGDTLGKIAKANKVTLTALEKANPGVDSTKLKIGQKINIPAPAPAVAPALAVGAGDATPAVITAKPGDTYKTKAGDTLAAIAKAVYGDEAASTRIWRANRDKLRSEKTPLKVGMSLKLPA